MTPKAEFRIRAAFGYVFAVVIIWIMVSKGWANRWEWWAAWAGVLAIHTWLVARHWPDGPA